MILAAFSPAPSFAASEDAAALLAEGHAEEAYQAYLALLRADPGDVAVNLGLARAAWASGHPHQAVMAYERVLAIYPEDTSLWRELAGVYESYGDAEMAAECMKRAKAGDTGTPVSPQARFVHSATLRFGAYHDSNPNQGLDDPHVNLGDNLNLIIPDGVAIESGGLYLGGQYNAGWKLSEEGNWWAMWGGSFNTRFSFDDDLSSINRRYSQWYKVSAGVRRLAARDVFDARVFGEILDCDFYDTVYGFGLESSFIHEMSPALQLILTGGVSNRRYIRGMNQTGTYSNVGLYVRFFLGESRHEFTLGGRCTAGNAKSDRYSYDGTEAFASLRLKLGNGYELSPGVTYSEERYDDPANALETEDRHDDRVTYFISFSREIDDRKKVEFSYQYTDNSSNSPLQCYDRHLFSIGMAWKF
jgi:tetratricopeptide (TPR) repeat protein